MTAATVRRIVLLGFMGAGKSTVAPILAGLMDWEAIDLDDEVARRAEMDVPTLIGRRGLAAFRTAESQAGRALLQRTGVVISAGGGWAAQPDHMEELGPETLSVCLEVGAETALRRLAGSPTPRPLLTTENPIAAARALIAERTPRYRLADLTVDTEGVSPEDVAAHIFAHVDKVQQGERKRDR